MKKTSIRLGLAVAFSALLFTACKKDKDEAPADLTKESIAGKYKLSSLQGIFPIVDPVDLMQSLPECQRDDIYTLNTDFSATYEDAGKPCGGDPVQKTTWSLDGKNITVKGGNNEFNGIVKSWDGKTLVIDCVYESLGMTGTMRGTLIRQ